MTSFGIRLRELRRRAGLSAERLAGLLGLHRNSVISYELDQKSPSIEIVGHLSKADLDWVYLVTGQPLDEFAADNIQWDLIAKILKSIDRQNSKLKVKLTHAQKVATLRLVYRAEIGRTRNVDDSVADALKVAA